MYTMYFLIVVNNRSIRSDLFVNWLPKIYFSTNGFCTYFGYFKKYFFLEAFIVDWLVIIQCQKH